MIIFKINVSMIGAIENETELEKLHKKIVDEMEKTLDREKRRCNNSRSIYQKRRR